MILICTSYLSLPKSALNLTRFNFIIAIGYVKLVSVVTNISLDLLSANLLHIDVWCLLLHLHKRQNALNLPVFFFFVSLPAASETSKLQIGIPDFKDFAI